MTDITPADLARFVHPVPVGATIPAGMEVVEFGHGGGFWGPSATRSAYTQRCDDPLRWTAEPLTAPKPPLPTKVGAVIANVSYRHSADTCAWMMLVHGSWAGSDQDGDLRQWYPDEITDWTPARIVTDEAVSAAEPDLMDESDKRPRIDASGDRVWWREGERDWTYGSGSSSLTLAEYAEKYARIAGWAGR